MYSVALDDAFTKAAALLPNERDRTVFSDVRMESCAATLSVLGVLVGLGTSLHRRLEQTLSRHQSDVSQNWSRTRLAV
jgi:hypothetical protein